LSIVSSLPKNWSNLVEGHLERGGACPPPLAASPPSAMALVTDQFLVALFD
jgi:hypothetical protein